MKLMRSASEAEMVRKHVKRDYLGRRTDRVKKREIDQMLRLNMQGLTDEEIAAKLDRKPQTVKHHLDARRRLNTEQSGETEQAIVRALDEIRVERKAYEETPHKRKMRDIARRLQSEITLPPLFHCFIVELKPRRFHLDKVSFLINVGANAEIGVELSIDNDGDIEQNALKSHLETGGFSDVLGELENWNQEVQQYLKYCHNFLTTVIIDIESKKRKIPLEDKKLMLGFTIHFPMTICADAIETASGHPLHFEYNVESHSIDSNFWTLRYGSYGIYIAKDKKTLERYQKTHKKLITKYASESVVGDIIERQTKINQTQNYINQRLRVFREKEHLPGYCTDLCC